MRRPALLVAIVVALVACAPEPAPPAPDDHGLASYLDDLVELRQFRGVVEVRRGDEVLLSKGFGQADVARDVPNEPDTRFRIASVTKMFTALAVLMLQEEGKLAVGDRLCAHLASCPAAWQAITIEQLLTHISGLWDYNELTEEDGARYLAEFGQRPTPAQLLQTFVDRPLHFPPGTRWQYNNCGYDLLGMLVERHSGQTYGEFLHDRILEPLGMADSAYDPAQPGSEHDATGYQDWTTPAETLSDAVNFANGGVYSTGPDLARWSRFLLTGKPAIVEQDTFAELLRPRVDAAVGVRYGYGVETRGTGEGTTIGHGGILPGFRSQVLVQPASGLSVVVLSNLATVVPKTVADNLVALAKT
ncbi:MAG: serine hydrolase domain-containing protein [Actinophytocola sp.]|uniref:serine hydrolase domain-containing protein n=1 Tax=Actinophytocola sp. TaxID=1872138 RepID=UPI003C7848D6